MDGFLGCLRCLLLVMCTYPFAKKALTLHLARGEGCESYFGCNLMQRKVLASSHQHLIAEAPEVPANEAGSYTLTAEGDVIFTAAKAAIEDVLDLLRRVTVGADKVERRLLEGQDAKIEVFHDDLYEEGHHVGD